MTLIQKEIEAKVNNSIENEAGAKTKVKHWRERKQDAKVGFRPKHMDQLTGKQCNAILTTRTSMIMVKANYKKAMTYICNHAGVGITGYRKSLRTSIDWAATHKTASMDGVNRANAWLRHSWSWACPLYVAWRESPKSEEQQGASQYKDTTLPV